MTTSEQVRGTTDRAEARVGENLSRAECLDLLGKSGSRCAQVSVGDADPEQLACFPLPDGDVLVPTGLDRQWPVEATGEPVTIEFVGRDGVRGWRVRVCGFARPMARRDRPRVYPSTSAALAMLHTFDNGVRVGATRIFGHRFG